MHDCDPKDFITKEEHKDHCEGMKRWADSVVKSSEEDRHKLWDEVKEIDKKIQVKACIEDKRKAGVRYIVRCFSMGPYTRKRVKYTKDEIDYIAAYDPHNDNVWYVPIKSFNGKGEMVFRYTKDDVRQISNKAQINLISDYQEIEI